MSDKSREEFQAKFPNPRAVWIDARNRYEIIQMNKAPHDAYNTLFEVWLAAKEKYEVKNEETITRLRGQLQNCAGCKNLKETRIRGSGFPVFGCATNNKVVPHETTTRASDHKVVFSRIPMWCPLPDSDVVKREAPAPQKTWTEVLVR